MSILQDHLKLCPDCTSEMEALKVSQLFVREIAQTYIPNPLSRDFSLEIHRKIANGMRQPSSDRWRSAVYLKKPALVISGLTLVILLFLGVIQRIWNVGNMPEVYRNDEVQQIAENIELDTELDEKYPTLESITVPAESIPLTFKLENTNITVIWFF